jgi:hypothetical protein
VIEVVGASAHLGRYEASRTPGRSHVHDGPPQRIERDRNHPTATAHAAASAMPAQKASVVASASMLVAPITFGGPLGRGGDFERRMGTTVDVFTTRLDRRSLPL